MKSKSFICAGALAAMMLLAGATQTAAQGHFTTSNEQTPDYIQVEGYAVREVTPDEFWLSITITERDSKGKISVEEQQRAMLSVLKGIGIDPEKQLKMADNSSEYARRKQALATAHYELKLPSAEQMHDAWAALSELNLSKVELSKASYSKMESLRSELRQEAIRNARQGADELASAIGQRAGRCYRIIDRNDRLYPSYEDHAVQLRSKNAVSFAEFAEDGATAIDFRPFKLHYQLEACFVLE